jgi:energy-converting hydrogenase Eha subunit F
MNLPPQWLGHPKIPPYLLRVEGLLPVWNYIASLEAFTAKFIFFLAIIVVLGVLLSIVYGYIYRMFGPSQYGPQDVPPPHVRTKKYRR